MKYVAALIAIAAVQSATATPPIAVEEITKANYSALGFDIEVRREGEALTVRMEGPRKVNDDCLPRRSGMLLLDSAGQELATYIASYEPTEAPPSAIAVYTDKSLTLGVFIDYICSGSLLDSRRYMVPSIAAFLDGEDE